MVLSHHPKDNTSSATKAAEWRLSLEGFLTPKISSHYPELFVSIDLIIRLFANRRLWLSFFLECISFQHTLLVKSYNYTYGQTSDELAPCDLFNYLFPT